MVWNLQFQFAGFILMLLVAGMCLAQRRLNFAAERAFIKLLLAVTVSILFDILSIFAINYRDTIGPVACEIVCKSYLFTIVVVACQSSLFSSAEIRHGFSRFLMNLTYLPLLAEVIVFALFPVKIHVSEGELYTYGVPVMVTYGLCALYLVSTLVMVIVLRHDINAKSRASIYFWMICWLVAAGIQFLNNQLLIVSFAMALACVYMYCKLENPEYHLDFATNVFNGKGFSVIMTENIKSRSSIAIISFVITDAGRVIDIFGAKAIEAIVSDISDFMDSIPGVTLFRLEDNLFCVAVESGERAETVLETVSKRFTIPWSVRDAQIEVNAAFSYIPDMSR
nr:hypothetical protein [Lachnospiraceae bacterium]